MRIVEELSDKAGRVVEELEHSTGHGNPNARSVDHNVGTIRTRSADRHDTDKKKIERYWELYKSVPIVREPIRAFSSEVVAPGYWIDAPSEEARDDLEDWLSNCAIVDGEVGRDFRMLIKKGTVQREVKGTSLSEKVYDEEDDERLYGFKLIDPKTVKAYTYPGQSVLLDPEDEIDPNDDQWKDREVYFTEEGDPAAFVQWNYTSASNDKEKNIAFRRDDIIKLTRDADVGEVFGTSRIASIENRLESLLKKLDDNDKAIESMAQPWQFIQFPEDWSEDEIRDFLSNHTQEDFEPGMTQAGNAAIDVETVSGEVAPINEYLQFDVNWIISIMPLPKYALGGFEEDVNQFVSRSQETRVEEQIKEARKEIEDEWTPAIQEKAEELGYNPDEIELVIGEPPETFDAPDEEERKKMDEEGEGGNNEGASGTDFSRPPASTEPEREEDSEE